MWNGSCLSVTARSSADTKEVLKMGTIIVAVILVILCVAVLIKLRKDKKNGKNSCGCNCGGCALKDQCRKK